MTLITLVLALSSSLTLAASLNRVPRAVVCQSLLESRNAMDPALLGNPLASLRDVQNLLKSSRFIEDEREIIEGNGYSSFSYSDSLAQPRFQPLRGHIFKKVLARLHQIESDTTGRADNPLYVAMEVRGREAVSEYFAHLQANASQLNTQVSQILKQKYPAARFSNILQYSAQAVLLGVFWQTLHIPDFNSRLFAAGATLLLAGGAQLGQYIPPALQRHDLQRQFSMIQKCLNQDCNDYPVSVVSGGLAVPIEFQRSLMRRSVPPLEMTATLSEPSVMNLSDLGSCEVDSQCEASKYLYYDSIFYVDQEKGEPVMLVYARIFTEQPSGPARGRKSKVVKKTKDAKPTPGIHQGLMPLPVRARK